MSNQKEIINTIIEMLPKEPRSYDTSDNPGFWSDGTEILCPTEAECEIVADFLRELIGESGNIDVHTGYYDPFEDAKAGNKTITPDSITLILINERKII